MSRVRFRISLARALGIAIIALLAMPVHSVAQNQPGRRFDTIKGSFIELPAKGMVARTTPLASPRPTPLPKQAPIRNAQSVKPSGIQTTGAPKPNSATPPSAAAVAPEKSDDPNNPTVQAGEVKWHASFAAACGAAKKSGKPVLLFHMMGQLDKQFC